MTKERIAGCISVFILAIPLPVLAEHQRSSGRPIDAVAAKYQLLDYSFEIGSGGTVAVRLEYDYPGTYMNGDDSDRGPGVRTVEVPGLSYDAASGNVVYLIGETSTVCAMLHGASHVKSTGQCKVETHVIHPRRDNSSQRDMLDVFLRVVKPR